MRATLFAVALPLLLAGCASQIPLPEVTGHKSPVTSGAKVPKTHHHTILTGYTHREPVTPDAWVPEGADVPEAEKPKDSAAPPKAETMSDKCKKKEGATNDCPTQ